MVKVLKQRAVTAEAFCYAVVPNPAKLASHHLDLLSWFERIELGVSQDAVFAIFGRGAAKSALAEVGTAFVGTTNRRRYCLYVQAAQEQADQKLMNIGAYLSSDYVRKIHPEVGAPAVNKTGATKGWRRNRLWTASGFVIDALGMDTAMRGLRIDEQRPDMIVLDDCDSSADSTRTVRRKIDTLTRTILPAGSPDMVVAFVQNLIHNDSMMNQIVTGRIDALANRQIIGPVPVVEGFEWDRETRTMVKGTPTWDYHDKHVVERMVADMGIDAFMAECQHDLGARHGALWAPALIKHGPPPQMRRTVVAVDPAISSGPDSDETGIVGVGSGIDGCTWVLADRSGRFPPEAWTARAVALAVEIGARKIVYEKTQGGNLNAGMLRSAIAQNPAARGIIVHGVPAKGSKAQRAQPCVLAYERGKVMHAAPSAAGDLLTLESQQVGWVPEFDRDSPDRVDALVHAWHALNKEAVRLVTSTYDQPPGEQQNGTAPAQTARDRYRVVTPGSVPDGFYVGPLQPRGGVVPTPDQRRLAEQNGQSALPGQAPPQVRPDTKRRLRVPTL